MPWEKGKSGNPKGRQSGRKELGDAFIRVLKADWEAHGAMAVISMRERDPVSYVRVVAAMLPEQVEVDLGSEVVELLTAVNEIRRQRGAPEIALGLEPAGTDAVRH